MQQQQHKGNCAKQRKFPAQIGRAKNVSENKANQIKIMWKYIHLSQSNEHWQWHWHWGG